MRPPITSRLRQAATLENVRHSGAQCSALRAGSASASASRAFPFSLGISQGSPGTNLSSGFWIAIPASPQAFVRGYRGPLKRSPNFGAKKLGRMQVLSECSATLKAEQKRSPHFLGHWQTLLCGSIPTKPVPQHPHSSLAGISSGTTRLLFLNFVAIAAPPPVGDASVQEMTRDSSAPSSRCDCVESPVKDLIHHHKAQGLSSCLAPLQQTKNLLENCT